jgi:hypothetical protein
LMRSLKEPMVMLFTHFQVFTSGPRSSSGCEWTLSTRRARDNRRPPKADRVDRRAPTVSRPSAIWTLIYCVCCGIVHS